jgi:hypothetical protein
MKTWGVRDEAGRMFAFEVRNSIWGRRAVCNVIRAIPGATVVREPRPWRLSTDDEFCEFELDGVRFVAYEPFGNNNRFWIGPSPPRWVAGIDRVQDAFNRAEPWRLADVMRAICGLRRAG